MPDPSLDTYLRENLSRTFHAFQFGESAALLLVAYLIPAILGVILGAASALTLDLGPAVAIGGVTALVTLFFVATPYRMWADERRKTLFLDDSVLVLEEHRSSRAVDVGLSGGFGPRAPLIRNRSGSPIQLDRVTAVPSVWFLDGDAASSPGSMKTYPLDAGALLHRANYDQYWERAVGAAQGTEIWTLQGLPLSLPPNGALELPQVMIGVDTAEEAREAFASSDWAELRVRLTAYTDVGRFPLQATPFQLTLKDKDGGLIGPRSALDDPPSVRS